MVPNRIRVFYHIYQGTPWRNLMLEQIDTLYSSSIMEVADLHIGITDTLDPPKKAQVAINNPSRGEAATIKALYDYCIDNPDAKVLYFHTKGVTHPTKEQRDWRRMMEYWCIERWKLCVEQLEMYDTVGCNFSYETWSGPYPHYSGNFWWANADYVSKCDLTFLESDDRIMHECFIGSGNGKMLDLHSPIVDLKYTEYPRSEYEDLL